MTENDESLMQLLQEAGGSQEQQGQEEISASQQQPENKGAPHQEQSPSVIPQPKEIFGEGVEDWDRAKSIWQETTTKANEVESLRQAKAELEAKLSEAQGLDFADEDVMSFNNFVKSTGQKDFDLFQKLKTIDANANPLDTLVLKEVLDNPELKGKEDLIRKKLMKQYETDPEVFSEEEVEIGNINIQRAAKSAAQHIETIKAKLAEKPVQQNKPNPEQYKTEWSTAVSEELNQLTSLEIPVRRGDKVEKLHDYVLTPELKQKYQETLSDVFSRAGSVSPEVKSKVQEVFKAKFISENLPDIIHAVETKITAELQEKYDREYNGYRTPKEPGAENPNDNGGTDYSNLF